MSVTSSYQVCTNSQSVRACLANVRALLANPACWDQTGNGPGWCPIRAITLEPMPTRVRFAPFCCCGLPFHHLIGAYGQNVSFATMTIHQ
jgi:hypothetical protein